jgi:uncharacterized protein (TIGR02300 family)
LTGSFHSGRHDRDRPIPLHVETEFPVANPEWGTKRICQSCSAKFYDLNRDPIVCPKCQTEFDPEAFLKTRRSRPSSIVEKDAEVAPGIVADAEVEDVETAEGDDAVVADGDEEEDEDLIEDASELGEDEDDLAEVIENVDEEEER